MKKSATEVMQEIVFAAAIDAVIALKTASKGLPNTLLRDMGAIHANTTLADLPPELQAAIAASVRTAFSKLLKEGYSVAPAADAAAQRGPRPEREGPRPPRNGQRPDRTPRRPTGRPAGGEGGRPNRGGRGPGRKPPAR